MSADIQFMRISAEGLLIVVEKPMPGHAAKLRFAAEEVEKACNIPAGGTAVGAKQRSSSPGGSA